MASTNQQITANLYQVFTTDVTGNISDINIANVTTSNLTANGNVTLGAIANVHITGGTSGQLLTTDGNGNLSFVTISTSTGNIAGLNLNGLGNTYLAGNGAWLTFPTANYGNIVNTNYSGNGLQVLAGNGVWISQPQGNIGNTNFTGNAQQYLNGAGIWTGIPGINVGNVAYANFTGVATQVLTGANTWVTMPNTLTYPSPANSALYLNGAGQWTQPPASGLTYPNVATQFLNGTGAWSNLGNIVYTNYNGNNSQVLSGAGQWITITGGTGNVSSINLNGNTFTYLNGAGQWANIPTGTGGSNVPNLNGNGATVLAGNGAWVPATSGGNVAALNLSGNANTVLSGTGSWTPIGNVAVSNYNGNSATYLNGVGQWVPISGGGATLPAGSNSWIQYNNAGAFGANSTFTFDVISSTMRSSKVSTDGLMNLQYATENVELVLAAPLGTYNFNVLSRSIHYVTAPATSNFGLAITGLSGMSVGQCMTVVFMMTSGTVGYIVSSYTIDSLAVVPKWGGAVFPTVIPNSITAYTLTITKISNLPSYTVFGNYTGYQ